MLSIFTHSLSLNTRISRDMRIPRPTGSACRELQKPHVNGQYAHAPIVLNFLLHTKRSKHNIASHACWSSMLSHFGVFTTLTWFYSAQSFSSFYFFLRIIFDVSTNSWMSGPMFKFIWWYFLLYNRAFVKQLVFGWKD